MKNTKATHMVKLKTGTHRELKVLTAKRAGSLSDTIQFLLTFYKENKKQN